MTLLSVVSSTQLEDFYWLCVCEIVMDSCTKTKSGHLKVMVTFTEINEHCKLMYPTDYIS